MFNDLTIFSLFVERREISEVPAEIALPPQAQVGDSGTNLQELGVVRVGWSGMRAAKIKRRKKRSDANLVPFSSV